MRKWNKKDGETEEWGSRGEWRGGGWVLSQGPQWSSCVEIPIKTDTGWNITRTYTAYVMPEVYISTMLNIFLPIFKHSLDIKKEMCRLQKYVRINTSKAFTQYMQNSELHFIVAFVVSSVYTFHVTSISRCSYSLQFTLPNGETVV